MTALVAIAVVGLGTYMSRAIFIIALANRTIPDSVLVALQFVAPAVLSALVVALLINEDGSVGIGVAEFSAFAVGALVANRSQNHIYTLVAGMSVFWVVRYLV